jgi:hypothetical protein
MKRNEFRARGAAALPLVAPLAAMETAAANTMVDVCGCVADSFIFIKGIVSLAENPIQRIIDAPTKHDFSPLFAIWIFGRETRRTSSSISRTRKKRKLQTRSTRYRADTDQTPRTIQERRTEVKASNNFYTSSFSIIIIIHLKQIHCWMKAS